MNHESAMEVRIINFCVQILFYKRELRSETQANSNVLINCVHNSVTFFKDLMNEEIKKHTFCLTTFLFVKKER